LGFGGYGPPPLCFSNFFFGFLLFFNDPPSSKTFIFFLLFFFLFTEESLFWVRFYIPYHLELETVCYILDLNRLRNCIRLGGLCLPQLVPLCGMFGWKGDIFFVFQKSSLFGSVPPHCPLGWRESIFAENTAIYNRPVTPTPL